MPLNVNNVCGLDPLPDNTGNINVRSMIPIRGGDNSQSVFKGSPYMFISGGVVAVEWSNDPTAMCSGSIVKLYNESGLEVLNLLANANGLADVTYRVDQRYQVIMSGTGFADDGTDNGLTYGFTTETNTADTSGLSGAGNSGVMADAGSEDPSANTFIASFKVRKPGNLGGVDKTLVEGKINPVCHQAW